MSTNDPLMSLGEQIGVIPVVLSYHIIEHFSGSLYSSPNKALEELVANSYDAMATRVEVFLPDHLGSSDAAIAVVDNGHSMGPDGLRELWQIGVSPKRKAGRQLTERPPIGRFGIGKLATYVLARRLSYLCRTKDGYYLVTMDFGEIEGHVDQAQHELGLRQLTEEQAREVAAILPSRPGGPPAAIKMFGDDAAPTWTVALMGHLKDLARQLKPGQLRWVLSTALPLSPEFELYFNGVELSSSRESREKLEGWTIGVDDHSAEELKYEAVAGDADAGTPPAVTVPGLGPITGTATLFRDPLTGGKAEIWGRSHGFFVFVRGRVINLHDPLFGLPQLSHGPFSRFRMEVHADGLDDFLRATRESVLESAAEVQAFRGYLQQKFNEVRAYYNTCLEKAEASPATRVQHAPGDLWSTPLLRAIRHAIGDGSGRMLLTRLPEGLSPEEQETFISSLEAEVSDGDGILADLTHVPTGVGGFLGSYDATRRTVQVNILHPYYANFAEHYKNLEPLSLLVTAEIATEAYLLDEGLSQEQVRNVLERRDQLLRALVYSADDMSAPFVATQLGESKSNARSLEKAVCLGLRCLGLEVSRIGGNREPDGLAVARMGVRDEDTGKRGDFTITYDAKSTGNDRVKAKTVGAATISRHRDSYKAQYALVVAPGFEGEDADADDSAAAEEARTAGITLMRVDDFATLILVAATRQLGFPRIQQLLETCHSARESQQWVEGLKNEEVQPGPL